MATMRLKIVGPTDGQAARLGLFSERNVYSVAT